MFIYTTYTILRQLGMLLLAVALSRAKRRPLHSLLHILHTVLRGALQQQFQGMQIFHSQVMRELNAHVLACSIAARNPILAHACLWAVRYSGARVSPTRKIAATVSDKPS
jgi:hypothetical protein